MCALWANFVYTECTCYDVYHTPTELINFISLFLFAFEILRIAFCLSLLMFLYNDQLCGIPVLIPVKL